MFGMGPLELCLVFGIVLLLFGGKRLPGIAQGLGTAIRNFKSALHEPENEANSSEKTRFMPTHDISETKAKTKRLTPEN